MKLIESTREIRFHFRLKDVRETRIEVFLRLLKVFLPEKRMIKVDSTSAGHVHVFACRTMRGRRGRSQDAEILPVRRHGEHSIQDGE